MIRISGLKKRFKSHTGAMDALRGIELEVAERDFCVLLGPSGCGKTTTLRCVAGLERPDEGEIRIGDTLVNSPDKGIYVPTERRDIGMVFQSYAVWPHMNVFQNVAFPLMRGRRKVSRDLLAEKVRHALKLVQLDGLETRPATDLSGGQQQRVAMARAIVTEPKILLMDEPLSNLDARLREQMRLELVRIARSIGVTTLYVTHDQAEALSLGDKVCVMDRGEILQIGTPREVYADPQSIFVAQFVGEMNFIEGAVKAPNEVESPFGTLTCRLPPNCRVGSKVTVAVRPEHLDLRPLTDGCNESLHGQIVNRNYLGDATLVEINACGSTLKVKLGGDADFKVGDRAALVLPRHEWRVYETAETTK